MISSPIEDAARRIRPYVHRTPIVASSLLNEWLGHEVYFKAECLQRIGAFKARGACNMIAKLVEEQANPQRIVANSSGNHAQAVAWASSIFNISSTIYMPKNVSAVKRQATTGYGAEVVLSETRAEADQAVEQASKQDGFHWVPPYNHLDVIHGQATVGYEIFDEIEGLDAVFAPCGGGGLLAGTFLAAQEFSSCTKVIGVEPAIADDARRSLEQGSIYRFELSPDTVADGARTLAVGDLTFEQLQKLDAFYTVEEQDILYWTQWLSHLLKLHIEPTSAMSMDAVFRWLKNQSRPQKVVVILSGGNIDAEMNKRVWEEDFLSCPPIERYE